MTSATQPTILIVDDTPTNIEVLAQALMKADYQVSVALDGESAISQIQYKPPTLVLLDVMMPGIDGFETCRRLKADPATSHIPIIFMTALSETTNKAKGFSLGAVDYITKPFDAEEVIVRVANHIKLYQLTTGLEQEVAKRTDELTTTLEQLQQAQLQLIQSERMSLIGELSAGLAHEISNPVNFIKGNLCHVESYLAQLMKFAEAHDSETVDLDIDLDFIREDSPKLFSSFHRGINKIQQLVADLCLFSGAHQSGRRKINLSKLLESCLSLMGHKLQQKFSEPNIQVLKDYQYENRVECYPALLSQALIGILLTYVNALELTQNRDDQISPQIKIHTYRKADGWVVIGLSTNLKLVFAESQPTENLNLKLAQDIVNHKHGGHLHHQSDTENTTITFELREILDTEIIKAHDSQEKELSPLNA
ncbi:MAG: response regulator [Cyanobacteria bacterium P01_D01_bin.105]